MLAQLVIEALLAFLSLLTLLDGGWYGLLAGFAAISGTATMLARGCGNELMSLQLAIVLNGLAICFSTIQLGRTLTNLINIESRYQTYDENGEPTANLDGLRVLLTVLSIVWFLGVVMRGCVTAILMRARRVLRLLPSVQPIPPVQPNPPVGRPVHVVEGVAVLATAVATSASVDAGQTPVGPPTNASGAGGPRVGVTVVAQGSLVPTMARGAGAERG